MGIYRRPQLKDSFFGGTPCAGSRRALPPRRPAAADLVHLLDDGPRRRIDEHCVSAWGLGYDRRRGPIISIQ